MDALVNLLHQFYNLEDDIVSETVFQLIFVRVMRMTLETIQEAMTSDNTDENRNTLYSSIFNDIQIIRNLLVQLLNENEMIDNDN